MKVSGLKLFLSSFTSAVGMFYFSIIAFTKSQWLLFSFDVVLFIVSIISAIMTIYFSFKMDFEKQKAIISMIAIEEFKKYKEDETGDKIENNR